MMIASGIAPLPLSFEGMGKAGSAPGADGGDHRFEGPTDGTPFSWEYPQEAACCVGPYKWDSEEERSL